MDVKTFVAQIVASLAWPITVLVCLPLLRKPLRSLTPLIRRLKYSDLELQFGREVADVKETTETAALKTAQKAEVAEKEVWQELMQLASVRPRNAVRAAWHQVESTLMRVAKDRNLQAAPAAWSMPMVIGALLLNAGVISDTQHKLLYRLRQLTSEAERAPVDGLAPDDAAEFVSLALRLAASLNSPNEHGSNAP